jgi:hypothetical protein
MTLCDECAGAASPAGVPNAAEPAPSPTPAAGEGRPKGRDLALMVGGVAAGAVLVFVVLAARGSSSTVDAAAKATAARSVPAAAPATASREAWTTDTRADWLNDPRRGAAFELQSDNTVQTWFGAIRPSLVVRCDKKGTDAFVFTRTPTKIEPRAEGKTVTVSVDGEPIRTEHWTDADDHTALFAPDGAAFAKRLRRAQQLEFSYTPHNSQMVTVRFHVAGLDALSAPAVKTCGWTK